MSIILQSPFIDLGQKILEYMPNLLAGLVLLVIGWIVGWIVKRIIVQLLNALKFERMFFRVRYRQAFSKGDIRFAIYNFVGNIFFFLIFLIFLNSALYAMKLTVLSQLIEKGVNFFPKLFISLIIFGMGWLIGNRVSIMIHTALIKENFPRQSLIARFVKFVIILFFSALALAELDIAIEIVIIGFTIIMLTLSAITIISFFMGGKNSMNKYFDVSDKD
jgi:Mechanosensitive ion channel, conserved TM helix